jgi:hypothetical protein
LHKELEDGYLFFDSKLGTFKMGYHHDRGQTFRKRIFLVWVKTPSFSNLSFEKLTVGDAKLCGNPFSSSWPGKCSRGLKYLTLKPFQSKAIALFCYFILVFIKRTK